MITFKNQNYDIKKTQILTCKTAILTNKPNLTLKYLNFDQNPKFWHEKTQILTNFDLTTKILALKINIMTINNQNLANFDL